ncbi:C-type lectin 1 [Elysia marginata]|uniref:C-type lectin 1 n=1 Tax=Elysia marginata TaxID=1093978 RepID=A0AAV4ETD1_9GAST|nr:C-type lectin 1 [Elysia marginata]
MPLPDARCPNGWITAGSGNTVTCYKLYSGLRKNFNQAIRFCQQQGGYIAKDLTSAIHNKIKRYIINAGKSSSHPTSFWLGLTDLNKNGGPWTWVGGPVLGSFKYFVSTPRNTRNKQDCAYVNTGTLLPQHETELKVLGPVVTLDSPIWTGNWESASSRLFAAEGSVML